MRRLAILGLTLVAMSALGVTATSAFALTLPDIHVLAGEKYPLHLNFADDKKTSSELQSSGGGKITGKGLLVLLLITELSALGTFEALFLNVLLNNQSCHSEGDPEGEVLTSGEFHIVPVTVAPLKLGIAFLVNLVLILCEKDKTKIHVLGCALASLNASSSADLTEVGGSLESDKKGKNLLTKYFNDEEKEVECKLLSNVGGGFAQSSEAVGEEIKLKALEKKMFEILNI